MRRNNRRSVNSRKYGPAMLKAETIGMFLVPFLLQNNLKHVWHVCHLLNTGWWCPGQWSRVVDGSFISAENVLKCTSLLFYKSLQYWGLYTAIVHLRVVLIQTSIVYVIKVCVTCNEQIKEILIYVFMWIDFIFVKVTLDISGSPIEIQWGSRKYPG